MTEQAGTLPYSLKVMGANEDDFETFVIQMIQHHLDEAGTVNARSRPSRNGAYLSVTVSFQVQNQEQVQAIYQALSAHQRVLMVL